MVPNPLTLTEFPRQSAQTALLAQSSHASLTSVEFQRLFGIGCVAAWEESIQGAIRRASSGISATLTGVVVVAWFRRNRKSRLQSS